MNRSHIVDITKGESYLLKIENDRLILSQNDFFPVGKVALGLTQEVSLKSFRNRFQWLSVRVTRVENGVVTFDILEFVRGNKYKISGKSYSVQKIKKVILESGNTDHILSFAERESTHPLRVNNSTNRYTTAFQQPVTRQLPPQQQIEVSHHLEIEKTIEITLPFNEVQFCNGYAQISSVVTVIGVCREKLFEFRVANSFLREEFNDVKPYFTTILKLQRVRITLKLLVKGEEIEIKSADSSDIARINEELIEKVPRKTIVREILRRIKDDGAHPVLELVDNSLSRSFCIDEDKFFKTMINEFPTKHSLHLQYLSSLHNSRIIKLRFYNNPTSFLFCIGEKNNHHFVWETFTDSLGTYIWSFDESKSENFSISLKQNLVSVETIIKEINLTGRNDYIKKKDSNFIRIQHTYNQLGFDKWKKEFEEKLSIVN